MKSSCRHNMCVSQRRRNLAARILSTTVLVCWKQHTLSAPSVASLYLGPGGGAGAPAPLPLSTPALSAQHSGLEPCKKIILLSQILLTTEEYEKKYTNNMSLNIESNSENNYKCPKRPQDDANCPLFFQLIKI